MTVFLGGGLEDTNYCIFAEKREITFAVMNTVGPGLFDCVIKRVQMELHSKFKLKVDSVFSDSLMNIGYNGHCQCAPSEEH